MMFPAGINPNGTNPGYPLGINLGVAKRILIECITVVLQFQSALLALAEVVSTIALAESIVAIGCKKDSGVLALATNQVSIAPIRENVEVLVDGVHSCT